MGITGLGLAWRSAASELGLPKQVGELMLCLGLCIFVILVLCQVFRLTYSIKYVVDEWQNASRRNFFCAATISGALLSQALLPYSDTAAAYLWILAVSAQIVFLGFMLRHWFLEEVSHSELSPAWLIPMVGNASPSFAGVTLGYEALCKILLTSALLCWAMFLPLILYRIIFVSPKISANAMPGLAILVSAPAVIAIAVFNLAPGANVIVEFLAWTALFFAVVVFSLGKRLVTSAFSRQWWAFTFPSSALASSLIRVYHLEVNNLNLALAFASLGISTVIVVYVGCRSIMSNTWIASRIARLQIRKLE
jgi:tellurite resistance protein